MKLSKAWLFVMLLIVSIAGSAASAAPIPFTGGTINSDCTLNVPSDFEDINAVLDYLNDKRIAANTIVSIQVSDGVYNYTRSIQIKHPDGDRIKIVGNQVNPNNCILNFSNCSFGIEVNTANKLRLFNGFTLVGTNSIPDSFGHTYGIYVVYNSYIFCGPQIQIQNFKYGILATFNSAAKAQGITVSNCVTGFAADMKSMLDIRSAKGINNVYQIAAMKGSFIFANETTISGGTTSFIPPKNTVGNDNSYISTTGY